MKHNYKAALTDIDQIKGQTFDDESHADHVFGQTLAFNYEALRAPLLIADAQTDTAQRDDGWHELPFEQMEKVYDAARGILLGMSLGFNSFEAMQEHLSEYGADAPPYLSKGIGHITKSEQAQILWEVMFAEYQRQAAPNTNPTAPAGDASDFVKRVMRVFSDNDAHDTLSWDVEDDGSISFEIYCNDWFAYASSYAVEITPDDISALEKAFSDVKLTGSIFNFYGAYLFAGRKEGLNPVAALLDKKNPKCLPHELLPLFNLKAAHAAKGV